MAYNITVIVYVVVQFVAFLLVLVGTPLDIFRERNPSSGVSSACITLFGLKGQCSSLLYTRTTDMLWEECPPRIPRFRLAQGCAIISIFVYGGAFMLGFILLFCCSLLRWVCLALNVVGMVTSCIVWAAMARTYNQHDGETCEPMKTSSRYGAGFALFVVAWILDTLNIILLLLPCTATEGPEDRKKLPPSGQE
ncbi:amastin-like surface protein [Leishmania donovani]|uniref:Amastin surface glycofamily protein n=1 Tax=Leishmania donovani TaxID=5661 RepID=A0A6J8FKZ8_LEIDO|nr:amastin-like surface protein [Leishmania donovani]VDZ48356.1 amastin-like_surface_protein_putative/GeneDB:LmjF.34.1560/GeneDB:LmjF.34.1580/GeneDB:LmjF.34.1600/GeneDB:LmjF.34.1620/GeneDB:LmjF.34.1640/GeneDB:LmjF.34.1660/GeneDB:LmjF.34.1680/GeneDB:LmjF.34.1700/GeneDB:LmjF.34.1720/GeneDB:LmjF.34.1740/GeneDB:LmjF.34.1760/GeneDB:LmjF.34.1780/GeneDB:LmjF.34.1800/GeneDB:LmjF.34.1820/GeneDB:LmjF.34.1860/GeneDB:LmjF.34.1880/GeneDB:LmjF.34.1900/GeneDB:LmjF.34.1920/GeneDB:LmjF.34.1940/GeneDB:LmjF.34.1960/